MRGTILAGWLIVPILAGAYHYGPGQKRLELDAMQDQLSAARLCVDRQEYARAIEHFNSAIAGLPGDRPEQLSRLRIERAKAQLMAGQLPAAYDEMVTLVPELQDRADTEPQLLADAQATLASAKYYLTWLMRLEGKPRTEWEPEIDGSRQLYRLLAEQANERGKAWQARARQEDLEAAVRLARLDLDELQALPLPSQCKSCCSGDCKCKGKKPGQKKSQSKPKSKSDARGASSGQPPDDQGN